MHSNSSPVSFRGLKQLKRVRACVTVYGHAGHSTSAYRFPHFWPQTPVRCKTLMALSGALPIGRFQQSCWQAGIGIECQVKSVSGVGIARLDSHGCDSRGDACRNLRSLDELGHIPASKASSKRASVHSLLPSA